MALVLSLTSLTIGDLYYTFENTIIDMQLWRLGTSLLFLGRLSFGFIVEAYLGYLVLFYSEVDLFGRKGLADYLMLVLFDYLLMLVAASFVDIYFLSNGFFFVLLYVESSYKPFQEITLIFNNRVPVKYFIWFYAGFNVVMGQPFKAYILAFLIGYLYTKIKSTIRQRIGFDLWPTPSLLKKLTDMYLQWSTRRHRNHFMEEA